MSDHTPGPWTARRVDNQQWEIDALHGDSTIKHASWLGLASVYSSDDQPRAGRMVAEANAMLIAAAPDLLEFAKWILNIGPTAGIIDERAKSVIAKAEGNYEHE